MKVIMTINKQTTEREHLKIFRAIPSLDTIKEIKVQWAGTWYRRVYEQEGKLKPRKKNESTGIAKRS